MNAIIEKWTTVERLALDMGLKPDTVRKWRERGGVPGKWQIPLIKASKGRLRLSDFEAAQ